MVIKKILGKGKNEGQISKEAVDLHSKGRVAGQKGNYEDAIQSLIEASKIEPKWPYPLYDLAFTYLLKKDYKNALKYYLKTDKLAPKGFFTSKTAIWTLKKEEKKIFPEGTYYSYVQFEWMSDQEKKLKKLKMMVRISPEFCPALNELSKFCKDKTDSLEMINKALTYRPDSETRFSLLMNKAIVLNLLNRKEEAQTILFDIFLDKKSPKAHKEVAKTTLNSIKKE